jgi:hypothetical protein
MTGTQPSPDRVPIAMRGWLRATSLGWLLGVPCILVLALVGEAIEIGGAQVLVGLGMGSAVGLLQGRAMRPVIGDAWPWVVASGVGLALPFLVADIAALREWELRYSLQWCVTIGGVIVGAWQALLLRARVHGTAWWLAASALGWTLAGAAARAADALTGTCVGARDCRCAALPGDRGGRRRRAGARHRGRAPSPGTARRRRAGRCGRLGRRRASASSCTTARGRPA